MANIASLYSSRVGPDHIGTWGNTSTSVSEQLRSLSSSYEYKVDGSSYMTIFTPQETGAITDCWVKVNSFVGTWSNTDQAINVEIREGLSGSNRPGHTLVGSFTMSLDSSVTGWVSQSNINVPVSESRLYSLVIGDADGSSANHVRMSVSTNFPGTNPIGINNTTVQSNDGFTTAGASSVGAASIAFKQSGIMYATLGYSSIGTVASSNTERGNLFKPPFPCVLVGFKTLADATINFTTGSIKLYTGLSTLPKSSDVTINYELQPATLVSATTPLNQFVTFPARYHKVLSPTQWYRLVFLTGTAGVTVPRKATIGGNPSPELLTALQPFGGNCYWTEESSGNWVDDTTSLSLLSPILVPATLSKNSAYYA